MCFSAYDRFKNPRLNAKIYKVLAHQFVNADYSIWIDGNVRLTVEPEKLVNMMDDRGCIVLRHCERDDIYQEAEFIIKRQKDAADIVNEQVCEYFRRGFHKKDLGMCFMIVRRHTDEIARRNERWWSEICRYSVRDQLSFPVAFDGEVKYLPPQPISSSEYHVRFPHVC